MATDQIHQIQSEVINLIVKKILHIIHGLNVGGAETFIYNLLQRLDPTAFKFDFAIQNPHIGHTRFKSLIERRGGKIFLITDFRKNPLKEARELSEILSQGYDYVHIHMNAFVNPIPAIVAARFNNKVIIHSHNTHNGSGGVVARFAHFVNRKIFMKRGFIRLACGCDAGRWMFKDKDFTVANNAVDLDKFCFENCNRKQIRDLYQITDEFVIGHMGRFVPEKNQKFLIDIIVRLKNEYPGLKAILMLCGDGPMREEMMEYSRQMNVADRVIFTGNIDTPHDYYAAFDLFALPSWFEGLAFVAIEAQASGLSVMASDTNTQEINQTGNVTFLPLDDSCQPWVAAVAAEAMKQINRIEKGAALRNGKYDLDTLADKMAGIYK